MKRISSNFALPDPSNIVVTDAETSIELDKSVGKLHDSKDVNFTKSIYEVTIKNLKDRSTSEEFIAYEARLRQEVKDWKILLTKALNDLKEAKKKHPIVDCSILSDDKRQFLQQAPDFSRFLKSTREFRCNALKFIENDYDEIVRRQQNIKDACIEQLTLRKENFLEEKLANEEDLN